jgi:MarR family
VSSTSRSSRCNVRKSAGEYDPFEKVSGTLGLSAAADSTLILDRDGNGATLYGRGRDVEEIEVAVTFDADTCKWRALGKASEVRRTDERAAILAALADSTEPMSPTEIADATRMSNQNVRQLLASMVKAGEVRKLRRGRYQHPDHQPPSDHNDHKITNLDDYRRARDGDDE